MLHFLQTRHTLSFETVRSEPRTFRRQQQHQNQTSPHPHRPKPSKIKSQLDDPDPTLSSVDYLGCCGAGHRFMKTADAVVLASLMQWPIRVNWKYCHSSNSVKAKSKPVDLFRYLWGDRVDLYPSTWPIAQEPGLKRPYFTMKNGAALPSHNHLFRVPNSVPGFRDFHRSDQDQTKKGRCICDMPEFYHWRAVSAYFYGLLRERFRFKNKVDSFVKENFEHAGLVIGMHIRTGNGEGGHFNLSGRGIEDEDRWLHNLIYTVVHGKRIPNETYANTYRNVYSSSWTKPRVLFVATDTASIISRVRNLVSSFGPESSDIKVLGYQQKRPEYGTGVNYDVTTGTCLGNWEASFTDMILLSHTDVVVAARPSSFTRSLPMMLSLSKPTKQRKVQHSFCELNWEATDMNCFKGFRDWCCRGSYKFAPYGNSHHIEIIQLPLNLKNLSVHEGIAPRPTGSCTFTRRMCIPLDPNEVELFTFNDYMMNMSKAST